MGNEMETGASVGAHRLNSVSRQGRNRQENGSYDVAGGYLEIHYFIPQ